MCMHIYDYTTYGSTTNFMYQSGVCVSLRNLENKLNTKHDERFY